MKPATSFPPRDPLVRVLITNLCLARRTGTELYVRDLAVTLCRRGHMPVVYSPQLGPLARELQESGIPVVDRLDQVAVRPDVVHGHHRLETMAALLHFPQVAGIFVCHDASAWHDAPPKFPRIRRYVAVDMACQERLVAQHGLPSDEVQLLQNAFDLHRFRPRRPLPVRPERALLVSNSVDYADLTAILRACRQQRVHLDVIGRRLAGTSASLDRLLPQYDLVFAKGRCAWEALASGAAVIPSDKGGMGELVTLAQLDQMQALNFGRRLLLRRPTVANVAREIGRYDAEDAMRVSRQVRQSGSLDQLVDRLLHLYQAVVEENDRSETDDHAESRCAAAFVAECSTTWTRMVRERAFRATLLGRVVQSGTKAVRIVRNSWARQMYRFRHSGRFPSPTRSDSVVTVGTDE